MALTIGIRREDKSEWERRSPLVPADVEWLRSNHDAPLLIQPSPIRAFSDSEFASAGARIEEDLDPAQLVLAVKEIPVGLLQADRVYVYFAHVIKGQSYNMGMLRRLLELGCTLVDYERIVDERNRRLIFFGRHAGLAGMVETLWGLGRRLRALGIPSVFEEVRHAYEYDDLEAVKTHIGQLGERMRRDGLPAPIDTLVVGFSGYGNVSRGAQEILECLPRTEVGVEELPSAAGRRNAGLLAVVFKEEHMVRPAAGGGSFELQEYYDHPERYAGRFEDHLPYLDVLVNTIYWEPRYPRLLTKEWARRQFSNGATPRLKIVGDISCDIDGAIELTARVTQPDAPCFVHDPLSGELREGLEGSGLAIMAVDNLPCELPRESSIDFGAVLRPMVRDLSAAEWNVPFDELDLPAHLKRAVIVHCGKLTPDYVYLEEHLEHDRGRS